MTTVYIGDNTTGSPAMDYSGTEDCYLLWTSSSTTNTGTETKCWPARFNSSGLQRTTLLRFTGISNLPASLTVSDAKVHVYEQDQDSALNYELRRQLRAWTETGATGDTYDGTNSWTAQGSQSDGNDRSATVAASLTLGTAGSYYTTTANTNLAADVEDFADGTLTNNGHQVHHTDTPAGVYNELTSSEGTDGQRPYLEVTYTAGGAAVNYYPAIHQALRMMSG